MQYIYNFIINYYMKTFIFYKKLSQFIQFFNIVNLFIIIKNLSIV
jgi:hypothetical protein